MKTKFILFYVLFSVCLSVSVIVKAQAVNKQDSMALVDLYNSTTGAGWTSRTNWLTSKPVKNWYGVVLTGTRITEISLGYNNLIGTIPSSLGILTKLRTLYLYNNQLSGNIPSELGNLINLEVLNLSGNQLSGNIPPELGNLVKISGSYSGLYLSYNQLSGSIPPELGNLVNISGLNLSNNQLSGSIPSELGNLSSIGFLSLNNNQLNGSIPAELGNLTFNEGSFDLSNNQLSGSIPPELGNLTFYNSASLNLSNNQLSGNIPPELGNLYFNYYYHSNRLNLSNNLLSGNIPPELSNIFALNTLDLSNNLLTEIPPEFSNDDNLNLLLLNNNQFTFDGLELIEQAFPFASIVYSPQAIIPIHQNDNLSVIAGGTLNNNTYKWFMVGQTDSTVIVGDSTFIPTRNGKYYAAVTNSICTQLTLYTDTIDYSALPVTITNLNAYQQKNIVKVDWTSLTEINVDHYEIQRSSKNMSFVGISLLTAKGKSIQQTNYSFDDLQPLNGDNYYRLKVFDKDGKITFSKIAMVNISNKEKIIVYPIPVKDILHVQTNTLTSFSLIDQSGKIFTTTNIDGNGTINVSKIPAGIYYLRNNGTYEVNKVVVVK